MGGFSLDRYTANARSFTPGVRHNSEQQSGTQYLGKAMQTIAMSMSNNRVRNDVETAKLKIEEGLASLDEKYKEDTDLATLASRRSEDVKGLIEGVRGEIHHRAASFLESDFNKTMMRDGRNTKSFVEKRDGQIRLAKMPEGLDLHMNKAIRAADGEEFAKAKKELDDYFASHRPFMGDAAYIQKSADLNDLIAYKRALGAVPGMVQRGEEFDAEKYMHLNPDQLSSVEAAYRGEIRNVERKTREYQSDRINAIAPLLEDSLASAMDTGVVMDGTEERLRELAGLGEQGAEIEAKFRGQLSRVARVWDTMDSVKHEPFDVQMQAVEALRPEPGSEGYAADMQMYQMAGKRVAQQAKAFQADPAGFVHEEAQERVQKIATDPWITEQDVQMLTVRTSMELQRERGAAVPRVLGTNQAKGLKDQYERADGQGKADLLHGLSAQYGDLDGTALQEMGLGYEHTFAAETYMDDQFLGRRLLDVMSLKEGDIGIDPEIAKGVKKDVGAAFYASDGPGELFKQWAMLTGNHNHLAMADRLHGMTVKMGLAGGDAAGAMDALWNDRFEYIVDDDVLIYGPKDTGVDEVAEQLREYRRNLPDEFSAFRDGIWKNSGDNRGFVLVLPNGGTAMSRDGKVVVVGYDELTAYESTPLGE